MPFAEEDYLQISGIEHFAFCPRQWALIHVEKLWCENVHTINGGIFHERAHDAALSEKRGDRLWIRGLRVFSRELGISGECDVTEFTRDEKKGVYLRKYDGFYFPTPVEYKVGAPKASDADKMQLCAQGLCLEEMLGVKIPFGYLFYGETKRRERTEFDSALRDKVREAFGQMHTYMRRGYTPRVKPQKSCSACSLKTQCLPGLYRKQNVEKYMQEALKTLGE